MAAVEEGSMVAVVAGFTVAVGVERSTVAAVGPTVVAGFIAVAEDLAAVARTAGRGLSAAALALLAEEVTTAAEPFGADRPPAGMERAGVHTADLVRRGA